VASAPALKPEMRVLFQGDSITDGNRGRNADPNHILGHGYAFILAAKYGAMYPERRLTFINRGISGNKVSDLQKRWAKDAVELQPDLLSILIGVNDLNGNVSAEEFERGYDALLEETRKALPTVKLVLMEPFGLPTGKKKEGWEAYAAELAKRGGIVAKLGEKYHCPVVKLQAVFEEAAKRAPGEYWIWDGVHPTYSGHQLIADAWIRAVNDAYGGK
jgi:lysophospholipase L1-like esterase